MFKNIEYKTKVGILISFAMGILITKVNDPTVFITEIILGISLYLIHRYWK